MKVYCDFCGKYQKFIIEPFTLVAGEIIGELICAGCRIVLESFMIDEDEDETIDNLEGHYKITKYRDLDEYIESN